MTEILENISLKEYNSFGIEARASRMACFTTTSELRELLAANPGITEGRWDVLGGGNNILFTRDYDGTLIHPRGGEITVTCETPASVSVRVEAGVEWDSFVAWSVERGYWGAENLSHIPSQTGAAPVQNIGAYGAEAKDIITSVEMVSAGSFNEATIAAGHCDFGYRDSVFKHALRGKVIITAVNFSLSKSPSPNLHYGALAAEVEKLGGPSPENIRRAVINIRRDKLPDPSETGNAGSFFKNPVVDAALAERLRDAHPGMPEYPAPQEGMVKLSAGWLIDRSGWKGVSKGRAGVYTKQALILVNNGGAAAGEIVSLAGEIADDVERRFGVRIEPEVNIW